MFGETRNHSQRSDGEYHGSVSSDLPASNFPSYPRFVGWFNHQFPSHQLTREQYASIREIMENLANLTPQSDDEDEERRMINKQLENLCRDFNVSIDLAKAVMGGIMDFQVVERTRPAKNDPRNN